MKNGEYELVIAPNDYPGKKYRGKYCYEHTLVWWQNTGTLPKENETLHHKNKDKRDNRFENLRLFLREDHDKYHGAESIEYHRIKCICPQCKNNIIVTRVAQLVVCVRLLSGRLLVRVQPLVHIKYYYEENTIRKNNKSLEILLC